MGVHIVNKSLITVQYKARSNKYAWITTYSGAPPPPPPLNRNAEWAILRTISYSLPRGHGIPSSYTRLNRQRKALHSVCLLATHVRAVGGHPLQWGGQLPPDQALLTYRLWGGYPLQWGAAISGSSSPPRTTSSGVRSPGGILLRSETPGGRLTPGGYFLRDSTCVLPLHVLMYMFKVPSTKYISHL